MSKTAITRLQKEFKAIRSSPVKYIDAMPMEGNFLEWHYVIEGPESTVYAGGYYHGKIVFPVEYPYKPPSIYMLTPNGRFRTNSRLCLSMSDFHPETWNPLWSVSSILAGLLSFMLENQPTVGSIESTFQEKRQFAADSLRWNSKVPIFRQLFSHLFQLYQKQENDATPGHARGDEDGRNLASLAKQPRLICCHIRDFDAHTVTLLSGFIFSIVVFVSIAIYLARTQKVPY